MPNSLKCRLKRLKNQGLLSEKDLSRIYTDNDVVEELEMVREKIRIDMSDIVNNSCDYTVGMAKSIEIIDNHIAKLKEEKGANK